jgi:3-dehydroquinate synthase
MPSAEDKSASDNARQLVHVELSERSYEIEIGQDSLAGLGSFLQARQKFSRAILVSDSQVAPLYGAAASSAFERSGLAHTLLTVPAGEASKSIACLSKLWDETLSAGADRKTVVVALGGGVVGDLAGFLAASFARGVPFVQVPTTLLAQVDSSVGGKVGINLPAAKNMVGAFWQPAGVLIDTNTLNSLPEREYRAGLAEVVKYGVILDEAFFAYLEANIAGIQARSPDVLMHIVARCCELKADVVRQDEREETGLRAVLNYGHTFAHAFESRAGYGTLLHGEAVSIGMVCAARLATALGRVDQTFCQRQFALLEALGLPTAVPDFPTKELIDVMQHDKKTVQGRLRFVLPTHLGHVELVSDVPAQAVVDSLGNDST